VQPAWQRVTISNRQLQANSRHHYICLVKLFASIFLSLFIVFVLSFFLSTILVNKDEYHLLPKGSVTPGALRRGAERHVASFSRQHIYTAKRALQLNSSGVNEP